MPSVSGKQRRFMSAELARKRSGQKTQTGMSEDQLAEFAGSQIQSTKKNKPGRSIVDVEIHTRKPEEGTLDIRGYLYKPGEECHVEKNHEFLSSYKARNIENFKSYGADVDFYGPDTDFQAEEINPHHYGRDYEPTPLKDLFKTGDKAEELGIRMREEYKYAEIATPGAVQKKALDSSLAYGTNAYNKIKRDIPDRRSFDDQEDFRRQHDETDDDMPDNGPKVKTYRHR